MSLPKKGIYISLVFVLCVFYGLYSISFSLKDKMYLFSTKYWTGNTSIANQNQSQSDQNETEIVLEFSVMTSEKESSGINMAASAPPPVKAPQVLQQIPPKEKNKHVDSILKGIPIASLYESGFIIPSVEICPEFGKQLQVAVIITSAPKHEQARMAIRQTWGHYQQRRDVAIAFLIGRSSPEDELSIKKEATLYGDIIQANFVDSYNNLTLKTISMLEWVDNYCHKVKFILKTDDDMFINIPNLLTFLNNHENNTRKIYGRLAENWKPIRDKSSKYYVTSKSYKNSTYPDFLTGPAYVLTTDIVHDLYVLALSRNYLKLEDVYITGFIAEDANVERVYVYEFFNRRVSLNACNIQKGISIHMVDPFEQYEVWKTMFDGKSECSFDISY